MFSLFCFEWLLSLLVDDNDLQEKLSTFLIRCSDPEILDEELISVFFNLIFENLVSIDKKEVYPEDFRKHVRSLVLRCVLYLLMVIRSFDVSEALMFNKRCLKGTSNILFLRSGFLEKDKISVCVTLVYYKLFRFGVQFDSVCVEWKLREKDVVERFLTIFKVEAHEVSRLENFVALIY